MPSCPTPALFQCTSCSALYISFEPKALISMCPPTYVRYENWFTLTATDGRTTTSKKEERNTRKKKKKVWPWGFSLKTQYPFLEILLATQHTKHCLYGESINNNNRGDRQYQSAIPGKWKNELSFSFVVFQFHLASKSHCWGYLVWLWFCLQLFLPLFAIVSLSFIGTTCSSFHRVSNHWPVNSCLYIAVINKKEHCTLVKKMSVMQVLW